MFATVLSDIALNIGALAAVVAAIGVVKAVGRAKRIEAKVAGAIVTIDGIDRMVNQQPKTAPTIPQHLTEINAKVDRLTDDVVDLHARFDVIEKHPLLQIPPTTP